MRPLVFLSLLALISFSPLLANGAKPAIPAVQIPDPPRIDGDLSDTCWLDAPNVTDFFFLPDGSRSAEQTTAWLCYDQDNIYIAFHCKDSQPHLITAQQKKRGGDIDTDDWVGFDLDTYNTFQFSKMTWVDVTAGGVQVENLQSGDVSKIEWKGDWNAATKRVSDGYTVEIAVPWSILQYDPSKKTMGVAFIRRHARTKQEWWSPNLGQGEDPKNFYVWEGLNLPKPRSRPLILPYVLTGSGDGNSTARSGLDVKHAITPSLTGVLTFNPDFRNVEQEVESIDFTYTERYYRDNRPFFQEGNMYFPSREMFYSRRINEIDSGAKLTGRYSDFQIATLHCAGFGAEDFSMVHIGREWPAKGNIRFAGVLSSLPDGDNLATSVSAGYRVLDKNDVKTHLQARVSQADSASGSGRGRFSRINLYNSGKPRVLAWQIDRVDIDPNFDPYLGYVPEKGIKGWEIWARLADQKSSGKLNEWSIDVNADLLENTDDSLYRNTFTASSTWDWRNGTGLQVNLSASDRSPGPGLDLYHDRQVSASYLWGTRDLYNRGGFGFGIGKTAGGSYLTYGLGQAMSVAHNLNVSLDYYYSRIKTPSPEAYSASQVIGTLAYDIDNERTLAGRIVAEHGSTYAYFAYRQRVRSGMDVYVIYGDPNPTTTKSTFLLKLIRPI